MTSLREKLFVRMRHTRALPGRARPACTAAVTAAAIAALALAPQAAGSPAPADPSGGGSVVALLRDLQGLYGRSESAAEAYNGTAARLDRQHKRTRQAEAALSAVHGSLTESRREIGRLARVQYRTGNGGLTPLVRLLLSRDPQQALDGVHMVQRAAGHEASTLTRLVTGERRQRRLTAGARRALHRQQALADRKKRQRDVVRARLHDVEGKLASLSKSQLAQVRGLETARQASAQRKLMASRAHLGRRRAAPSRAGEEALRYALRQLGKPYAPGATGPGSYDCSGLTFRAWKHAGRAIPRTSQQQWQRLRHVSLSRLRPGDLIVYYRAATHIGMYVGAGKVVHAPRPGERVQVSPLAQQPVRGAVRPDAGAKPTRHYRAPKLPG